MISCVCSVYDGPPAEFVSETFVKAAKTHRCCECGDEIKKGERHQVVKGKWDGDFSQFRTCVTCVNVRKSLLNCDVCYGTLWEDIRNALEYEEGADPDDDYEWLR